MNSKSLIILLIGVLLCQPSVFTESQEAPFSWTDLRNNIKNGNTADCSLTDWQSESGVPAGLSDIHWQDMSLQNVEAVMKTGKQGGKEWYDDSLTTWGGGTDGQAWQMTDGTDTEFSKFIIFGKEHKAGEKYVRLFWLIEVFSESSNWSKPRSITLNTYLDAGKLTQLACLGRKNKKTDETKWVPARNSFTVKEIVLGSHNGGQGTGHGYFYFGHDCVVPPVHPPPNGEDPTCIWAIMAGKQFRDGRVTNTVKISGDDQTAMVKCIQDVYATRTSTLKCFYTGLGTDGEIPADYIEIKEPTKCGPETETYIKLNAQGYSDVEIQAICQKVATDTPSGCIGWIPKTGDSLKFDCVCPANFIQNSKKYFEFNQFRGPTSASEDRSLKTTLAGGLPSGGCKTDSIALPGCLVTEIREPGPNWMGDVSGELCRVCKKGWYLDYTEEGSPHCAGIQSYPANTQSVTTELPNCPHPAIQMNPDRKAIKESSCAMCEEGYYWNIEQIKCTKKVNRDDGVDSCWQEYGNYSRIGFSEKTKLAQCYDCATGNFLNSGLTKCEAPQMTGVGNEQEKNLFGCRVAETNWIFPDRPGQLGHFAWKCYLCHIDYIMTGPNGIQCRPLHYMGIVHDEEHHYQRKVQNEHPSEQEPAEEKPG